MTLNELEEFIDEEYEIEFAEDSIYGSWRTIEQELKSLNEALTNPELVDNFEEIREEIKYFEKLKNKDLQMKYALNGIWSQGWIICKINDKDYNFVDFYRTI